MFLLLYNARATSPNDHLEHHAPRFIYSVNVLAAPKAREHIQKLVSSKGLMPRFVAFKLCDMVFKTKIAPHRFCKYIASEMGLISTYIAMLDHCGETTSRVLKLISQAEMPVLFHCSLGKDRTGVIAMLISLILGASDESIVIDYAASTPTDDISKEEFDTFVSSSGLSQDFASAKEATMRELLKYFKEKFGDQDKYLDNIGFDSGWRAILRSRYLKTARRASATITEPSEERNISL